MSARSRADVILESGLHSEDEPLERFQYVRAYCPWCRQSPAQRLTYIGRWCRNCGMHRWMLGYYGRRHGEVGDEPDC